MNRIETLTEQNRSVNKAEVCSLQTLTAEGGLDTNGSQKPADWDPADLLHVGSILTKSCCSFKAELFKSLPSRCRSVHAAGPCTLQVCARCTLTVTQNDSESESEEMSCSSGCCPESEDRRCLCVSAATGTHMPLKPSIIWELFVHQQKHPDWKQQRQKYIQSSS